MSFVSSLALSCDAAAHQLSDARRAQTVAAALDPLLDEADRIVCKVAADGTEPVRISSLLENQNQNLSHTPPRDKFLFAAARCCVTLASFIQSVAADALADY